jgi:ribosomal protein L11 methyltransferase
MLNRLKKIQMETYVEICLHTETNEQAEILIAQLEQAGFEGFEERERELFAFVKQGRFQSIELQEAITRLSVSYSERVVPPTNWNTEWEKNFEPVLVDNFCYVRAPFHPPVPGVQHDLLITPKMSFGTGHHATTWMVIHAMKDLEFSGKRVLDFGTGTGILAILAEKCGAELVLAIDNDEQCILNASENISDNQCDRIKLQKQDHIGDDPLFDIILANINRNTILANLAGMRQHLTPQGVLVLSGLLEEDLEQLGDSAKIQGLISEQLEHRDHWVCVQLKFDGPLSEN